MADLSKDKLACIVHVNIVKAVTLYLCLIFFILCNPVSILGELFLLFLFVSYYLTAMIFPCT